MDARHPPPPFPPHPSPILVGRGSASFSGQPVAVYVTLVTLHMHFQTATVSHNALSDDDFDLLQLTEEERAELVAVVNQEGNDTTHTTGKSIFHVYFAHLKTSYVDRCKRFFGSNGI